MTTAALTFCLALHRAHARLRLRLDEDLGVWHGIDLPGLALLDELGQADGHRLGLAALAARLALPRSAVMRQVLAMEKIGLVSREDGTGMRLIALRPAGRALAQAAGDTAGAACAEVISRLMPSLREGTHAALLALAA